MDFLVRVMITVIVYLLCGVLYNKGIVQNWAFFVFMGYLGSAIVSVVFVLQQNRNENNGF